MIRRLTMTLTLACAAALIWVACSNNNASSDPPHTDGVTPRVTEVDTSGDAGAYTFSVTLRTPDTGCDQYADWWEVTNADGTELLYRRILAHSHVNEQPFTRSGGTVAVDADTEVVVRTHMSNSGYSRRAMRGSVGGGFAAADLADDFGAALEQAEPQPSGCAF